MTLTQAIAAEILGRSPRRVRLQTAAFAQRRVLITGAAGSIGSALAERVAALSPKALILLDNSDHGLVEVLASVTARASARTKIVERLCDVRDRRRLDRVLEADRPDLVIHAAALKYVHFGDRHPGECVLTNLIGVRNVVEAFQAIGGGRFVLVSTDKAAIPISVMGATKRLAEAYVRSLAPPRSNLDAIAVRFGNVFGTRGSVAPIFANQIANGGPVTVSHPEMVRYFMLLEEAVDLILRAAGDDARTSDGESPLLLLDMGEPVMIVDLARRMIDRLTPPQQAKPDIVFSQIREGERLREELHDDAETLMPTSTDGVWRVQALDALRYPSAAELTDLETAARANSDAVIRNRLFAVLDRVLARSVQESIA